MDPLHVGAALLSAFLHAAWNAAVKSSPRPVDAMTGQMLLGAVLCLPILLWTGLPAAESWGWIVASSTINLVTVAALLRAYEIAGFGLAYPVIRALAVMTVVPLAAAASGEWPSGWGLLGVAMIALALVLLALGSGERRALNRRAMAWVGIAAGTIAVTVLCDAQGVRDSGSPLAYGITTSILNALANAVLRRWGPQAWRASAADAVRVVPVAIGSMISYLLILWVYSEAPIAPSAALRDTSAIFAILIAVAFLGERFSRLKLCAVLIAALAVPLLRLA